MGAAEGREGLEPPPAPHRRAPVGTFTVRCDLPRSPLPA